MNTFYKNESLLDASRLGFPIARGKKTPLAIQGGRTDGKDGQMAREKR